MDAEWYPYLGKLAALAASIVWSCSITLYRAQGDGIPAQTLNLYKLFVAFVGFSAFVIVMQFGPAEYAPRFPASWQKSGWLMVSGIIGLTLGDTLFFFSIKHLGAGLTSALQCLTPPLNALIDWLYLNKQMTSVQMVGLLIVVIAVAGVVLAGARQRQRISKEHDALWFLGLLTAIGSAISSAVSYAITGEALKGESIWTCNILRFAPAFAVLLLFAVGTRGGRAGVKYLVTQPRKMGMLTLAAFLGTIVGISLLSFGFQHADTGIVSTLSTTYPIWVVGVAALFLKEYPSPLQLFCTLLAIFGIALLMLPASVWSGWLIAFL